MKAVTGVYIVGGLACLGMLFLIMNVALLSTHLDSDKTLVTHVVYEPEDLDYTTKPYFDKIILITPSLGSRDSDRTKLSRDTVRNTWLRDTALGKGTGEEEGKGYGVFFVCTVTDTKSEAFETLIREAVSFRDMVILEIPPGFQLSDSMLAVDWARDRFRYNVMLTGDDMAMVNVGELDDQIDMIAEYNITGASLLSKAQNLHIWSSGAILAFDKEPHKTPVIPVSDTAGIRELVANQGLVTTKLEGYHPSWRGFCKAAAGDTPWILIQALDPQSMNRLWELVSKDENICTRGGEPKHNAKETHNFIETSET